MLIVISRRTEGTWIRSTLARIFSATTPAESRSVCGPGGATTIGDVVIVLHAYTAAQGPGEGKPRNAWAGLLAWDSAGLPYVD